MIKSKKKIEKYYRDKRIVGEYIKKRFIEPIGVVKHQEQVDFINNFIKERKPKKILEIACGPGRLTVDIKTSNGIAIDSSETMLDVAKERTNGKWLFKKMNAFNLKFQKNSFDLVFTFRFIRHFERKKRNKIYREIRKVLKPQGYLIFDAVNITRSKLVRKIRGKKVRVFEAAFTKEDIKKEMKKEGFKIMELRPVINHFIIQEVISKLGVIFGMKKLSEITIKSLEKINGKSPWEWIVLCQKK